MRLPAFITKGFDCLATRIMASRAPDIRIGPDGDPYMERWHAIPRNKLFNIYVHLYHHDDDRILHSHPWWSLSILTRGGLIEFSVEDADDATDPERYQVRFVRPGDLRLRSADMYHRLQVVFPHRTVTVFFTGPKIKSWYFACRKGLVEWTKFVSDRDRGIPGAGCGELT